MPKKLLIYALIILGSFFLAACNEEESSPPTPTPAPASEIADRLPVLEETELTTALVYYATSDYQYLLPLNLNINATKEVAHIALEKLLAGPPNSFAAAILPTDTKLIDLYSSQTTVYVDLTADILTIEAERAQLAVEAIAHTVLPLAEGFNLQILVEGQVIPSLNGVDISEPLHLSYINLDLLSRNWLAANSQQLPGAVLTYYLPDPFAMYLIPQTRLFYASMAMPAPASSEDEDAPAELPAEESASEEDVGSNPTLEPNINEQYAIAIVEALLTVDPESGLYSPFWPGTTLNGLSIEDNIAYVDFSADILGYSGGSAYETLMMESLVNSLTRLPEINGVQVLINGSQRDSLPEGLDISRPLVGGQLLNYVN